MNMSEAQDLTGTTWGYACLAIFVAAYGLVVIEDRLHLRKSIPALVAGSVVWLLVAVAFTLRGQSELATEAFKHNLLDYAELMLFLLAAMTFVNTLEERKVFDALRAQLAGRGFSLRRIFWITGALAFVISPIADNLTTALIMGAVVMAVGKDRPKFVVVGCINVVVAANAGGAFSPFGDITTLMAWQRGVLPFTTFFSLLGPSLV
ncbi:MAG: sodium:proton antiporter NhaD, partial [Myxococcales bacterium]